MLVPSSTWAGSTSGFSDGRFGCSYGTQQVQKDPYAPRLEAYAEHDDDEWSGNSSTVGFKFVIPLGKKPEPTRGIDPALCEQIARQAAVSQRMKQQSDAIELEIKQLELELMKRRLSSLDQEKATDDW